MAYLSIVKDTTTNEQFNKMKKVFLLLSMSLLLLSSCSKENSDSQMEDQALDMVYYFSDTGDTPVWEAISLSEISNLNLGDITNLRGNNGNSGHAHGDFAGIEFSGTQNNGGTHGTATANFGPFTFSMETACVMVDENEAVYGGTIIELDGPPTPPGFPISLGNQMFFKVIDNGQGNNAPLDQFNAILLFTTPENSGCGTLTPSAPLWSVFPDVDIQEPGSIKVNN